MSIGDLTEFIPPPSVAAKPNWPLVEAQLGTELPFEYKMIVDAFGLGTFGGIMTLFTPMAERSHLNLISHHEYVQANLHLYSGFIDYPIFPDRGGLLAFGACENWEMFYWITEGKPNEWPILLNEQRGPRYDRFEVTLSEFMTGLLRQELKPSVLADDYGSLVTSEFEPIH